ncbi:beta-hexosaminidase [Rufibacter sp. DG15C]|uniref:family 20 glycosylhydrolase n=1 Tax=Rufibacter sp. DG15C TaxID=1379909 RepID=UPI00078C52B4|nr:family 20 glycosylhydrolase [Rufibacter sp. DG15C]AMM52578.1 beta-hexosaminidase [Rufibacter sp. DG15C]
MTKQLLPLLLWSFLMILAPASVWGQTKEHQYNLIPYPNSLIPQQGTFTLTAQTRLVLPKESKVFASEAEQLQAMLAGGLGKRLKQTKKLQSNSIVLQLDKTITTPEGYQIFITPKQVRLVAKEPAGMFRAVQTLRQLLPVTIEQSATNSTNDTLMFPSVQITDAPAFGWRGMHLDVSRHFFTKEYLKKYIDLLALYKFNKLHLHLTDDQGWRLEIKKYPKLTEEGAWRMFNNQDSVVIRQSKDNPDMALDPRHLVQRNGKTMYGGFYTQAEMREIIQYASARHIEIIPEIDMPGHMKSAIDAYPFLTCGEAGWGKTFSVPICPCEETTYEFAENVFQEIIDLFPSQYIHLGADEVEKTTWVNAPACQALMQREGLKSVEELQSYFVHRMQKFFKSKGKTLIGWDEVLEGGINSEAVVMYWRNWVPKAPLQAVHNGNKVIMTPNAPLYFDALPDKNSLKNVYHFQPVPSSLNPEEAKAILGAQANLWTEYIPSENRAEYLYMPRMTALAEAVWSKEKNFTNYQQRLKQHYPRLDALNVQYRLPDLEGFTDRMVFTDQALLEIHKPLENFTIRYTTDGSEPTSSSPELPKLKPIAESTMLKLSAFIPSGRKGDTYTLQYEKQALAPPIQAKTTTTGLNAIYYKGFFKNTLAMQSVVRATETIMVDKLEVPLTIKDGSFGIQFRGYLDIPETGIYSFYLICDDGGVLNIANRLVVDNDGLHAPLEKSGQVALEKGLHPLELDFIEGGGGYTLKLLYSKNGSQPQPIPQSWLMR